MLLDLRRAWLVFWVAVKYGAGPLARTLLHLPAQPSRYSEQMRRALEELGVTFLKLGQYLAMRFDILPAVVCRELGKLFEDVRPMTFEEIRTVVERELSARLEDVFPQFNRTPIAAASVAQVHEARTYRNERVAVKVQRPGIDLIFKADVRNLRRVAAVLDAFGLLGSISITEAVDQFAGFTLREMDFMVEGRTADRLRAHALRYERVPEIKWALTTRRVLTMEFVEGISLSRLCQLAEAGRSDLIPVYLPGVDLEAAVHHFAYASLHQLFVLGFFHADPHPGNLLIRGDSSVAFVDFGIFGELGEDQREICASYIENLAIGNIEESFRDYLRLFQVTDETDLESFKQQGMAVLARWYRASLNPEAPPEERHLGKASDEMLDIVRRNHLRMSMDMMLFWRALIALDSSALRLANYFDLVNELRSFFELYRPTPAQRLLRAARQRNSSLASVRFERAVPGQVYVLLRDLAGRRWEPTVRVRHTKALQNLAATGMGWLTGGILVTSAMIASTRLNSWWGTLTAACAVLILVALAAKRRS